MRENAIRRTIGVIGAAALALGGVLITAAPAQAADSIGSVSELNDAIGTANGGAAVEVELSAGFAVDEDILPLTAGSLSIEGHGLALVGDGTSAFFDVSGTATLAIHDLVVVTNLGGPAITSTGVPQDPASSPTVALSAFQATTAEADAPFTPGSSTAVWITDTALTVTDSYLYDSGIGLEGAFSFGESRITRLETSGTLDCGIAIDASGTAVVEATELGIAGAGCTGLAVTTTDTASVTVADSTIRDSAGGAQLVNGGGTIVLRDSTIAGSTSEEQLVVFGAFDGTTRIIGTTITGGADVGLPAVAVQGIAGAISIEHSTITRNAVDGVPVLESCSCGTGSFALDHTIVAGNIGTGASAPDVVLEGATASWNLIGEVDPTDTVTLDILGAGVNYLDEDPQLGPLADNGGASETHLPATASPVVNAGDPAFSGPPALDQRGAPRVSAGIVDIGAVEVQFSPVLSLSRASGAVGDTLTVTGSGFPPSAAVALVFNSDPVALGTVTTTGSGSLSLSTSIPTSVSAGAHTVTASIGAAVVASAAIEVTGLPDTGSASGEHATTWLASLLLVAGIAAIAVSRRHRRATR